MELNYFKDILFDLINNWEQDILEILSDDKKNLFWVVMGAFFAFIAKRKNLIYFDHQNNFTFILQAIKKP